MSTLAKIFVVINLFLSLAYVGVMAALMAESDTYKVRYENTADELAATASALTARYTQAENQRSDQVRENSQLMERYKQALEQWERARAENKRLMDTQADLQRKFEGLDASYKSVDDRIQRISDENNRLNDEIRQREGERDDARGAQREAEEAFLEMLGQLEDAEDRLRQLGEEVVRTRKGWEDDKIRLKYAISDPGGVHSPVAAPPIDGKIVAVSADVPLVMISVGKDDMVQTGYVFTVYRGASYVAKVRVEDVFKDHASAMIVEAYKKLAPREGDNVSTRIP